MPTKTIKIYVSIAIIVLLASCIRNTIEEGQPNKIPTSTQVTETEPVSVVSLAQTSVSDVNYLRECKTINPTKLTEQIPYENIWPGETKESELESLLGTPDKIFTLKGITNLVYDDTGLLIENGIVTDVRTPIDEKSELTLERLVLTYGCPDIVFAVNTTEDQIGYTSTLFIYHNIGVEIRFFNYPSDLADIPTSISYSRPMDLQEYLQENGWTVMSVQSGKPIEWSDAVK